MFFASGRVRQYLQTALGFITTRVKDQCEDYLGKLKLVMKYIKGTLGFNMTLREDTLSVIKWWIYAPFSTHNYCQGYTGGMMSLGAVSITS